MRFIKYLIKQSKWFHRKSQHYIMGNWSEYESVFNNQNKRDWVKGYIPAYFRYMKYSISDYFRGLQH